MPISTGKLTTLGQLKLQAERIKQELALYAQRGLCHRAGVNLNEGRGTALWSSLCPSF